MEGILFNWTLAAVVSALAGGAMYGWVVAATFHPVMLKGSAFRMVVLALLWFLPQYVQRAIDTHLPPGSAERILGGFLLYLVVFVPSAVVVMLLRRRP